jgi:hypothetical protein
MRRTIFFINLIRVSRSTTALISFKFCLTYITFSERYINRASIVF